MLKKSRAERELDALLRRTRRAVEQKKAKEGLTKTRWKPEDGNVDADRDETATEMFNEGKHRDF